MSGRHNFQSRTNRYDPRDPPQSQNRVQSQSPPKEAQTQNGNDYHHYMGEDEQELEILRLEEELKQKELTLQQLDTQRNEFLIHRSGQHYTYPENVTAKITHPQLLKKYKTLQELYKKEQYDKISEQRELNERIKSLLHSEHDLKRQLNDVNREKVQLLGERTHWESQERQYLARLTNMKDYKKESEEMLLQRNVSDQSKIQMQKYLNDANSAHSQRLNKYNGHNDELIEENAALKSEVISNSQKRVELTTMCDKLNLDNNALKDEIYKLREQIKLKSEVENQRDKLLVQIQTYKDTETSLNEMLQQLQVELQNHTNHHKSKLDAILQAKRDSDKKMGSKDGQIAKLEVQIARLQTLLKGKDLEIQNMNDQMQSRAYRDDEYHRNANSKLQEDKNSLIYKLEQLEIDLQREQQKNRQLNDRILQLIQKLKQRDDQIARLKNQKPTFYYYRPVKDDPIDVQLAYYLNNLTPEQRPRAQFVRESQGVYSFGTRRIYIRLQARDKLIIRVGGGYMTIKEFIEVYDQIELEKEQGLKSGTRLPAGMRKSISGESPRATSGRAGITGGSNSARSNKQGEKN